jgi:hypothetical protein
MAQLAPAACVTRAVAPPDARLRPRRCLAIHRAFFCRNPDVPEAIGALVRKSTEEVAQRLTRDRAKFSGADFNHLTISLADCNSRSDPDNLERKSCAELC